MTQWKMGKRVAVGPLFMRKVQPVRFFDSDPFTASAACVASHVMALVSSPILIPASKGEQEAYEHNATKEKLFHLSPHPPPLNHFDADLVQGGGSPLSIKPASQPAKGKAEKSCCLRRVGSLQKSLPSGN